MSWYLWLHEGTAMTCSDHYMSIYWHVDLRIGSARSMRKKCHVSYECSIWCVPTSIWWNLSSASIDCDIFIFLPLNSFLAMFADLTYLFLSSLSLKSMKAYVISLAGHLIFTFSVEIPISVIVSLSLSICSSHLFQKLPTCSSDFCSRWFFPHLNIQRHRWVATTSFHSVLAPPFFRSPPLCPMCPAAFFSSHPCILRHMSIVAPVSMLLSSIVFLSFNTFPWFTR